LKSVVSYIHRLSVRLIASIVLFIAILGVVSGFFVYHVLTQSMMRENAIFADQITDTIIDAAWSTDFQKFMDIGLERITEVGSQDRDDLMEKALEEGDQEALIFLTLDNITKCITSQIMMGDVRELGIYIPRPETGYTEKTLIIECKAGQNKEAVDFHLLKDTKEEDSDEVRDTVKRIWTRETEDGVVLDYTDKEGEDSTIAVYKGLYNEGEVTGILLVKRSVQRTVETRNRYLVGLVIVEVVMLLFGILILALYLRFRVVKPVDKVTKEADRFSQENTMSERKLADDVGNVTEIRILAESIDQMEENTMRNIEKITRMSRESERIDTELSLAANLQASVLPKKEKLAGRKEFDVSALMKPAREVGGDFYDFFMVDDTHLALMIADVSDKGIGSAFFMASSKTLLKARASMGGKPEEIVTFVEEKLSEENEMGMFVSVWLGIVDLTTGEVQACNAGHNYPGILHKDTEEGYLIEKTEHGPPICFLPGIVHKGYSFRLCPGDRIFLYTDGVTEAKNPEGERFGNDRLIRVLNDDREVGNESLIIRVKAAVDHFAGEEPQYDDITMVSFQFLGNISEICRNISI